MNSSAKVSPMANQGISSRSGENHDFHILFKWQLWSADLQSLSWPHTFESTDVWLFIMFMASVMLTVEVRHGWGAKKNASQRAAYTLKPMHIYTTSKEACCIQESILCTAHGRKAVSEFKHCPQAVFGLEAIMGPNPRLKTVSNPRDHLRELQPLLIRWPLLPFYNGKNLWPVWAFEWQKRDTLPCVSLESFELRRLFRKELRIEERWMGSQQSATLHSVRVQNEILKCKTEWLSGAWFRDSSRVALREMKAGWWTG